MTLTLNIASLFLFLPLLFACSVIEGTVELLSQREDNERLHRRRTLVHNNNNEQIKKKTMAHEIFIEPELENLHDEATAAEWFEICSQLGLQNQIAMADKSETKMAPPYMFCDPKTKNIIECLCPRRVEYKEYKASTIPLDVVKEIKKCEANKWYMKIEICYDDKSPDPFVVGILPNEYEWRGDRHLIARWGAELIPFEQLEDRAIARMKDGTVRELSTQKFKIEHALANPEAYIRGVLSGNGSRFPF